MMMPNTGMFGWHYQVCPILPKRYYYFDLVMGCCNSGQLEIVRDSFEQAWQVFKGTDLSRPERFVQNRQRVFRFLFLSIVLPQTKQTRDRVGAFGERLPKDSRALGDVRQEMARLDEEIVKLQGQRRTLHQDFAKQIKSDMISVEEVQKSLVVRDQREDEEKMDPRGDRHAGAEPYRIHPLKQSVSQIHQSHIRSSYEEYSIPLTAMDSMLDPMISEDLPRAESSDQRSRIEQLIQALEFQSDKRKALELQVLALDVKLGQHKEELVSLEDTRAALLKELGEKQEIIEKLKNEQAAVRLQEEIIEMRRDKEEMEERVQQMQLQLEQFRGEVARLDREREQALSQNKYLSVKVKDLGETLSQTVNEDSCNVSLSILPHLAPPRKRALTLLPCVLQERVEPSSRISEHKKMDRSYIMVEDQGQEQGEGKAEQLNGYSILFNLFSNTKVLPSHADFQAAVGMRTIIADLFQHRPLKSELLFSFDPITPNHFAKYIQNRENLLLLVRLPNGITLGGFAGNFVGANELTESFLFSLDPHREPMKLTPAPGRRVRRIDIDPGQLTFGNGELRVKAKSLEVGSSVGCFQSLFCWGKRAVPVEKFLGTSERTLMANAYEIHQLHFA